MATLSTTAPAARGRTATKRQQPGVLDGKAEVLMALALAAGAALCLLPLLVVALPVALALALLLRGRPAWWLRLLALLACLLPAAGALLLAWLREGVAPEAAVWGAVDGYLDVQVVTAVGLLDAALAHGWEGVKAPLTDAGWWRGYGLAVWGWAVVGGPLVAAVGLVWFGFAGITRSGEDETKPKPPRLVSADELGKLRMRAEAGRVDGLTAQGRLTAITALPKQGKTVAWMGLLRARQDGGTWFGRRCTPGKTLVMTEEDRGTFSAKVKQFGINGRTLVTLHAPEAADATFQPEAWEAVVTDAAVRAKRAKCDTLCIDTLTTWAPWAFRGPEAMSTCLRTLKRAVGAHKLAGCVILHNRKQKSDEGAVVDMLGTIAGSAAYDVIAGFKREKESGECTLTVDGRLGEWQQTARLVDGRYVVPVAARAAVQQAIRQGELPPVAGRPCATEGCNQPASEYHHGEGYDAEHATDVTPLCKPCHDRETAGTDGEGLTAVQRATVAAVRAAGPAGLTTDAFMAALGITKGPASQRLRAAETAGLLVRSGGGRREGPQVWRCAPG